MFRYITIVIAASVLFVLLCLGILLLGMRESVSARRSDRIYCATALMQIRDALSQFRTKNGYAARDIERSDGEPVLSWRVGLTPLMVGIDAEFAMDQAWDSPTNARTIDATPIQFRCITDVSAKKFTSYVLARCQSSRSSLMESILPPGTCVIEVHGLNEWTRPGDIEKAPSLEKWLMSDEAFSYHDGEAFVLFGDGTIRIFARDGESEDLQNEGASSIP